MEGTSDQQPAFDYTPLCFPGILGPSTDSTVRYHFQGFLNRGTFGQAWSIKRVEDGRIFAGKIMFLKDLTSKQVLRARTEVSCIRNSATHFGCVGFIEDAKHDDKLLIVLEYCDAGNLAFQIEQMHDCGATFPEDTVKNILLQLVLSLNFLHRNCVLHRDLTANNVLLSTSGLVKIGDFGMSKEYDTTRAQTFCGTPTNIAPEVWAELPYGRKADVWSLGVVLYELMTGVLPFPTCGGSWDALRSRIKDGKYQEPDEKQYSKELREILALCLKVDAAERIDTDGLLRTRYLSEAFAAFPNMIVGSYNLFGQPMYEQIMQSIEEFKLMIVGDPSSTIDVPNLLNVPDGDTNKNLNQHLPKDELPSMSISPGIAAMPHDKAHPIDDDKTPPLPPAVLIEGPIAKYKPKEGVFVQRYVRLTAKELIIFYDEMCEAPSPMSLKRITAVTSLTESNSNSFKNVFALQEDEDKCYWLQAPDEASLHAWVTALRSAIV